MFRCAIGAGKSLLLVVLLLGRTTYADSLEKSHSDIVPEQHVISEVRVLTIDSLWRAPTDITVDTDREFENVILIDTSKEKEELRPIKKECGETSGIVISNDIDVEVGATGTDISKCCANARIKCSNSLLETIERFIPNVLCPGCACPQCGAKSCEALPKLPKDTTSITNSFLYAGQPYCEFSQESDDDQVKCKEKCRLPGSHEPRFVIGCTACAPGHEGSKRVARIDPSAATCED